MKQYIIQKNLANKALDVKLMGKFNEVTASSYMKEFNETLKSIQPKEYDLNFDTKDLQVSTQEMIPMLEQCFALYKQLGFKHISVDLGANAILKMQVSRLIRKTELIGIMEIV